MGCCAWLGPVTSAMWSKMINNTKIVLWQTDARDDVEHWRRTRAATFGFGSVTRYPFPPTQATSIHCAYYINRSTFACVTAGLIVLLVLIALIMRRSGAVLQYCDPSWRILWPRFFWRRPNFGSMWRAWLCAKRFVVNDWGGGGCQYPSRDKLTCSYV
jgi:hypothetical protein